MGARWAGGIVAHRQVQETARRAAASRRTPWRRGREGAAVDGRGALVSHAGMHTRAGRRFQGKVAVITGASAGIGAATARRFAQEGAAVALAARGRERLEALAEEIGRGGGRAIAVPCDVADGRQAAALLARAEAELGGVDVLVNNAAAHRRGPIERHSAEDLAELVQVNLTAPIVLTRLCLPLLRRRGGGAIVQVASLAGFVPLGHAAVYSATKFGLRAFSLALREELRGSGIHSSVVSPGPVDTGFLMEDLDEVSDLTFAQPMSTAEQIADLILDCAEDGRGERVRPALSARLATLGYLLPPLRELLAPILERRGRRAKEAYRRRGAPR